MLKTSNPCLLRWATIAFIGDDVAIKIVIQLDGAK